MDALQKNMASAESEYTAQKSTFQEEAEMGEMAASVAAKAPVSPETVIEGVRAYRSASKCSPQDCGNAGVLTIRSSAEQDVKEYALPVLGLIVALVAIIVAFMKWINEFK